MGKYTCEWVRQGQLTLRHPVPDSGAQTVSRDDIVPRSR